MKISSKKKKQLLVVALVIWLLIRISKGGSGFGLFGFGTGNSNSKDEGKIDGSQGLTDLNFNDLTGPEKRKFRTSGGPYDKQYLQNVFSNLLSRGYSQNLVRTVERIYRHETANFTSGQYESTGGAGMEAVVGSSPPNYGWSVLKGYQKEWKFGGPIQTDGTVRMTDSGGRNVRFIRFREPADGIEALLRYLLKYKAGRWYSTNPTKQAQYMSLINKIPTQFT